MDDIFRSSLEQHPVTRLGRLMAAKVSVLPHRASHGPRLQDVAEILTYCEEFVPGDPPEFFFDRNPETFPGILDMFRCLH